MIDLHCHLDGSLPEKTVIHLAEMEGIALPEHQELGQMLQVKEKCSSLEEYLEAFNLPLQLLQTSQGLKMAAYDLAWGAWQEGVIYLEVRFAPLLHCNKGLTVVQAIEAVLAGLGDAEAKCPIRTGVIVCAMRHEKVENNLKMLKAGREFLGHGVCALDLAGNEAAFPASLHRELFAYAAKEKIPFTIHAGECGNPANVTQAIELGARRIGHGIAAMKDKAVMQKCAQAGVYLELCPVSNLQTKAVESYKEYPLYTFLQNNILATINTDNRTVSATSLEKEFTVLEQEMGLPQKMRYQLLKNAANGAFTSEAIKAELLKQIESSRRT